MMMAFTPRPCTWNGVEYPSIKAAAEACGITPPAMRKRLRDGMTCDEDVRANKKPFIWNGIEYPSQTAAAEAAGVTCETIRKRRAKGQHGDGDMRHRRTPCTWNGIEYPSMRAAARASYTSPSAMADWIKRGWACDEDVERGQ